MKRKIGFVLVLLMVAAMGWGISVFAPAQSQARSVVAIEGAKFDTSLSLADNIKSYTGKDIFVHLKSGHTLQGYVKSVGNDLVHLEKLDDKNFYDALIRIDEISAMEAKFREMK